MILPDGSFNIEPKTDRAKRVCERMQELNITSLYVSRMVTSRNVSSTHLASFLTEEHEDELCKNENSIEDSFYLNLSITLNLSVEYIIHGTGPKEVQNPQEALLKLLRTEIDQENIPFYLDLLHKILNYDEDQEDELHAEITESLMDFMRKKRSLE